MKKFFALLVTAALLCCMFAVPASADTTVTFTIGTVNDANPGDTVLVPINISANGDYEAHVLTMHVTYDATKLSITGYTAGDLFYTLPMDASKVFDYATNPGDFSVGIICPTDGFTGSGTLLNIKFKVAEDCTENQVINAVVPEFTYSPLSGGITNIPCNVVPGAINLYSEPVVTPEPTATPEPIVTPEPSEPDVTPEPSEPDVTPEPSEPTPPTDMSANFTVTPKTVAADGSTITLQLSVSGNFVAHTMNLSVDYDTDALTAIGVVPGAALSAAPLDAAVIIDYETIPGSIRLGLVAPSEGFSSTGVLLEMTFKVADDFKTNYPNGTPVTVSITEFDNMPVGAVNGVVIPSGSGGGVVIPPTGAISLIGLGVVAIASGAGIVLFRRKEN